FLFVVVYSLNVLNVPLNRVALTMAFLLPLVFISSLGTSAVSESKILSGSSSSFAKETINMDFAPGDILIYQYDEADLFPNYYFPTAHKVLPSEIQTFFSELKPGLPEKRIFVTAQLLELCPWLTKEANLKQLNSNYWRMETVPSKWKLDEKIRVLILN